MATCAKCAPTAKSIARWIARVFQRIGPIADNILEALKAAGGALPLHDNSPPEEIRATLGISKKAFKQAIGRLFRDRLIFINPREIRLVPPGAREGETRRRQ